YGVGGGKSRSFSSPRRATKRSVRACSHVAPWSACSNRSARRPCSTRSMQRYDEVAMTTRRMGHLTGAPYIVPLAVRAAVEHARVYARRLFENPPEINDWTWPHAR